MPSLFFSAFCAFTRLGGIARLRHWLWTAAWVLTAGAALAQQNWRWVNPSPAGVAWRSVAYGNGVYVVVGDDATIATSPDGVAWTLRRMSTAGMDLVAIAFADGRFVAVGNGTPSSDKAALIMTSTDGFGWTIDEASAGAVSAKLSDVAYGNGVWVAIGTSTGTLTSRVFVSADARTWVSQVVTTLGLPSAVTEGGGRFIAYGAGRFVVFSGGKCFTSTDGVTWVAGPFSPDGGTGVLSLAYGGGKFFAVGTGGFSGNGVVFTSSDGITWTLATTIPLAGQLISVAASTAGGAVAIPINGTYSDNASAVAGKVVYNTTDGILWTKRASAMPINAGQVYAEYISGVAYAGTQFFVLGVNGSITTSPNGSTWTRQASGPDGDFGTVFHDGRRFVATGTGGAVLTSNDGTAWTQLATTTTNSLYSTATNGTRYVAAGYGSGISSSADLVNWTAVTDTGDQGGAIAVYGNGRFVVAPGSTSAGTRTSTDGVTWSKNPAVATRENTVWGLASGEGSFVMITSGGSSSAANRIYSSTDGANWTDSTPAGLPSGTSLNSVAFGGGRFVIATLNQRTLTSIDGLHWTVSPLPSTLLIFEVGYVGGQFVAQSSEYGYRSYSSLDGIGWTAIPGSEGSSNYASRCAVAGKTVVGVGYSGAIFRGDLVAAPAVSTVGRLSNLSIRTVAGTGDNSLIVGAAIGGAGVVGGKSVLFRGIGPSLAQFGITGALADPVMTIYRGSSLLNQNDDWNSVFDFGAVGAFALAGTTPRDSGVYISGALPNTYSIQIAGKNNASGVALAEIYDATPASAFTATTPRLVNVSARTQVGTGDNIVIAGFVIGGATDVRVLIRAVGPGLTGFGVGGVLADPKLEVYRGSAKIAENDNWGATAGGTFTSVGAFPLAAGSPDAALVATLSPGAYSAQVSGVGGTTGVALVEVYELP